MVSDPKGVPLEFIHYFLGTKDHKALGLFSNFWGIYNAKWGCVTGRRVAEQLGTIPTSDSRWASRHKWLTKTRNEPQGGARVRKDGLLRFQARSAQLERATKLAALIGWELSVFSSLFSTGRDWRSSIARKLRREKDCRCLGVRGLTSWLPTKHTWDCSLHS